jgi:hypothetical protein
MYCQSKFLPHNPILLEKLFWQPSNSATKIFKWQSRISSKMFFEVAAAANISRESFINIGNLHFHPSLTCLLVLSLFALLQLLQPPHNIMVDTTRASTTDDDNSEVVGAAGAPQQEPPRPLCKLNILLSSSSDGDDNDSNCFAISDSEIYYESQDKQKPVDPGCDTSRSKKRQLWSTVPCKFNPNFFFRPQRNFWAHNWLIDNHARKDVQSRYAYHQWQQEHSNQSWHPNVHEIHH